MPPISVIIVGAGPSGLLLAQLLAKQGVEDIQVLEREKRPTHDFRAVFYQPIAFHEFKRAGIWEDVQQAAKPLRSVCWRDAADQGKRLFGMPSQDTLLMSLNTLTRIIRGKLSQGGEDRILFGHEVVKIGQDADKAWVEVKTDQGETRMEASYVVGCDGAQSAIRRLVFGDGALEGFTWDKTLVAADIEGNLSSRWPDIEDSNIFLHPTDAWILFRLPDREDLWRIIYQDTSEGAEEAHSHIEALLTGDQVSPLFKILGARPYRIHQRIVSDMVKGRVILAADAAHLCCPYGALGLNGGIADVGSLADCLTAMHEDRTDTSVLDIYSQVRREKWQSIIDPTSQRTLRLVYSKPADIIPDHPLYKMCKMFEQNPEAMKGAPGPDPLALRYDFSRHFQST